MKKKIKSNENSKVKFEREFTYQMNKQLEEGKQFANDVEDLKRILNSTAPVDVDAKGVLCLMLWCGKLIDKIEKLEAENKRFREALEFYANKKSYFNDPDETALFSRWCILYGDIEEINDSVGYAGKRAREALKESE